MPIYALLFHLLLAFSRAGLQRGTKDRRGTQLFDETVRLLRTSPPRIGVVLENVPRLLTWDNGSAHRHVCASLEALGFRVHHRVLNSADYGLPQQRKRLLYVAVRPGHAFDWPAPVPLEQRLVLEDVLEPEDEPKCISRTDITCGPPRYPSLTSPPPRQPRPIQMGFVGTNRQGQRIYHRRGAAPTLTCWTPIRVYEDQDRVRITRPREMARLQGVPEWLPVPKSEQAANSLMGNAVAAHVVAHVAQRLALGRPVTASDRQ